MVYVDAIRGIIRAEKNERGAYALADTRNETRNSQPCEKYARKVPTYLQMRNHKDMHHVYATLETILPDLSLFNYFGCILKCN